MLGNVELVPLDRGPVPGRGSGHLGAQTRNAPDRVQREPVTIEVVQHDHVERRCRGPFPFEAAHMDIVMVGAAIG